MKALTRISLLLLGLWLLSIPVERAVASAPKIALERIEMVTDTFEYTGRECRPEFTVYDENGDAVSPESYTCRYIDAVNSSDPDTKIYIKANEDSPYKGSLKESFYITPVSITRATVAAIPDTAFTGGQIKPLPELTYNGIALVKGTDYTLKYESNTDAGTASIIITGSATASENKAKKNFTDTITVSFEITPLSIEEYTVSPISNKSYTGSAVTPGITLTSGEKRLGSSNYTVSYKNNVNAGTATVTATGIGNYFGSVSSTFKILPRNRTPKIYLSETRFTYDGKVKKPTVKKVTVGSDEKVLDSSQYTVSYSGNCKSAGTYTVTVTLRGNYSGTNTKSFVIEEQSLADAELTLKKRTYTYSGKEYKPGVTVTLNGVTLKKGTDYKVIYSSNKNPGNGSVRVEGIGNYKGKSSAESFLIRKDIQKFNVSVKAKSFKIAYSKVKKSAQKLTVSKMLKITDTAGAVTYEIGRSDTGFFIIDKSTGTITAAKGTPKGTYELTLRLCAEGDSEHVKCYRLADIRIVVK